LIVAASPELMFVGVAKRLFDRRRELRFQKPVQR